MCWLVPRPQYRVIIRHNKNVFFIHAIKRILKLWSVISRCHRLTRRSSADKYVCWSLFTEMELMWYVWALENIRRGLASTMSSIGWNTGTLNRVMQDGSRVMPPSSFRLNPAGRLSRSVTFHNLIVLSKKEIKREINSKDHIIYVHIHRTWLREVIVFIILTSWITTFKYRLPLVERRKFAGFARRSHRILLIFSSISKLFR